MRKILVLLSIVMMFGVSNIALAAEGEPEEPMMAAVEVEEVQEEIITEEELETEVEEDWEAVEEEQEETTTEDEEEVEESGCPHTWGEWEYDLTEHDDGSVTYFRICDCGVYEEMEEQAFCDAGGQYENCDAGRHYWFEDADMRYCEECGYTE